MSYRSESNNIGNKLNYTDLNLSHFPNQIDTRINNTNMRGFVNIGEGEIPDFVMAEYVNAIGDAVMAIERALGQTPMVPFDASEGEVGTIIENGTVSTRLSRIEDGLFDVRYGGAGWQNIAGRPTLSSHNHDGLNGHPGKINLVTEITGRLNKGNINLLPTTGLTGADIYVSRQNQIKINEAINDSLSKSAGGNVTGDTSFEGSFRSRTRLDKVATDFSVLSGVSLVSDRTATSGRRLSLTTAGTTSDIALITSSERASMLFGRYVIGVRVKTSNTSSSAVLRFLLGGQNQTVTGEEIGNGWNQIYWVFTHDISTKGTSLRIQKLATAENVTIDLDNAFIEPIHPAVLDR